MIENKRINDVGPLLNLLADFETRARLLAEEDPNDVRAKVYTSVASRLQQALKDAASADDWRRPNDLAAEEGLRPDTVRSWVRKNKIEWRYAPGSSRLLQVRLGRQGAR